MRKIFGVVLVFIMMFTSCAQYNKVMVSGIPGTVIKDSEGEVKGTIGENGMVEIQLSRDYYSAFLLSRSPYQNVDIPFALDYKTTSRAKWVGCWIGYWTGLVTVVGITWAFPCCLHSYDSDIYRCYEYLPAQTNDDLTPSRSVLDLSVLNK